MGLDNIECREIATKMFLQENQYKLVRKLKRKKNKKQIDSHSSFTGAETEGGGGGSGGHS